MAADGAPMLMLEWYHSTPLGDGCLTAQKLGSGPGLTELSKRLLDAFDNALHCDCVLHTKAASAAAFPAAVADKEAADAAGAVAAHRIVLRRNPQMTMQALGDAAGLLVDNLRPHVLKAIIRAHYAELKEPSQDSVVSGSGPTAQLAQARSLCTQDELATVDACFGALVTDNWLSLDAALASQVFSPQFADVLLEVSGGFEVPAHQVMICSPTDGHFFAGALRWPGAKAVVHMPEGLSREALLPLLRLRYGSAEVEVEHILEMRHFAELFDWPDVKDKIEASLEALLADAGSLDAESLLTVVAHVEQSCDIPVRLRAAALASAVRQWSKVTEAAAESLPKRKCVELSALNRIRNRDGHVCGSLEEYLYACSDDLIEWERSLALDAPAAVRKQVLTQIESAWNNWHQMLFEFGHMNGAAAAEKWREKVRGLRAQVRDERAVRQGARLMLPKDKVWFEATWEWQEVPKNAVCPGGLEYRFDMQSGRNFARLV